MLVLANGAFKSGSTWLREIVKRMHPFEPIPAGWERKDLPHWLDPAKIEQFLRTRECEEKDFISKSHIFDERLVNVLLESKNARVLDITRDIKDSIVSHYYHVRRERNLSDSFSKYYWRVGRYKAYELRLYHQVWDTDSANVYTSSFEELKRNFHSEVRRLGDFLGKTLTDEQIEDLKQATSIENLRSDRGESGKSESDRFFRKGEIGDWKNHFGEAERNDIEAIYRHGLSPLERVRYTLSFTLRRRLTRALRNR